jgi:capsular polysaccharide transport system permease protein
MERDKRKAALLDGETDRPKTVGIFSVSPILMGSRAIARQVMSRISLRPAAVELRSEDDLESSTLTIGVPAPKPPVYLLSFILAVVIPAFMAIVYLAFIASDQYVAEARFAVRTAQLDGGGGGDKLLSSLSTLGSGLGASMPALAGQDPYIVTSYVHSRAIIDDLSPALDLRAMFTRPGSDFWSRLKRNASIEDLVDYWNGMVTTYVDGPSGIVTIDARAFRPDDALALSQAIITASEKLVNEVSARARNDAMRRAEEEVRRYEGQVRLALQDLRKYRDGEGFIDPVSTATSTSKLLLDMMAEKIRLQNDLFVATKAMSQDAPTVQTLKTRSDSLDKQIETMKASLAGNTVEGRTISNALVKFEELELQRTFAEKLYTMAQDGLERARVRAEQQNLYISVFVPPSLPQEPKFPERLAFSFIIPIGLLVLWGIFALIGATVEDHRI